MVRSVSKHVLWWAHYGKEWGVIITALHYGFYPRLIKDKLLLLNCSCNYIRNNRLQSPSIRGVREGSSLFKWSHKVLSESSSASSWKIKNRKEQLTSSYSRFLRNGKMPDCFWAVWRTGPAHTVIAGWPWPSNLSSRPDHLGSLVEEVPGLPLGFWLSSWVVGAGLLHSRLPRWQFKGFTWRTIGRARKEVELGDGSKDGILRWIPGVSACQSSIDALEDASGWVPILLPVLAPC